MGSRQSVVQQPAPRHRTQSHASTSVLNGGHHQAAGSSDDLGASTSAQAQNSSTLSSRSSRQIRSHSVIVPAFSSSGHNNENSSDSSDEDAVGGSGVAARRGVQFGRGGIATLDRLLRMNPSLNNMGLLFNRVPFRFDLKCPVCHKIVPSDDVEYHLVVCLTRPRLTYNDDVLTEDKGECIICFDDMRQGDTIARLPCLCIYHKGCIDTWFKVKNSCPEHPSDD